MHRLPPFFRLKSLIAGVAAATTFTTGPAVADEQWERDPFRWVGTFDVIDVNGSAVAEIIDVADHRPLLVYTDADNEEIGFVDITRPYRMQGLGVVALDGEPTSLVIREPWVLVAVNTSSSFTEPSGKPVVVNIQDRRIVAEYDLGGQPDSIALDLEGVAVGPDGNFWLGSEGNSGSRENLVLKVNPLTGDVIDEIALTADGRLFAVTDNDGVDDAPGETVFLEVDTLD